MATINFGDLIDKLDDESDRAALADLEQQRALFLKYVVREGNFPDRRKQLLKDYKAGASLTGPKGLRRKLGAIDLEYFGRAYLGHYFTRPAPAFHAELDDKMCIRDRGWSSCALTTTTSLGRLPAA